MEHKKKMDFDGVFEYIGEMGIYQVLFFMILAVASFTSGELIFNNFIGFTPDHWCHIEELEDLPHHVQKNVASPMKTDSLGNTIFDSCRYYNFNYSLYTDEDFLNWNRSVNIGNDTATALCQNGWVYDQSVVVNSIVTKWDLFCNDGWKVQLLSTIYVAGSMFSSLVVGPISNRFGRRIGIALFSFLKIAPAFLSALSPVYPLMAVANFFLAVGSTGNYVLCYTAMIEIVGPKVRSQVGMGFSIICSFGFMCSAVYGYFIRDEFKLQLVRAGIPCTLLLACWITHESPRWLLLNGRNKEAENVIRKIAMVNGKKLPEDFDVSCLRVEKQQRSQSTIIDVFRSSSMRKRALILCLHWFTDSLILYALSLNTAALSGDLYLNTFLAGAVEIPANFAAIFLMNSRRIGRRGTAFLSLALAGVSCIINIPLVLTQAAPDAVTVLSLLGKGGATMGFNSMYLYTSELFPTEIRDSAIGMCSFAARVSGMAAPFVGGPLGDVWAPLPNIIFGSFSIVTAFFSLFLPETFGRSLPDSLNMAKEQERKKNREMKLSDKEPTRDISGIQNNALDEDISIHL